MQIGSPNDVVCKFLCTVGEPNPDGPLPFGEYFFHPCPPGKFSSKLNIAVHHTQDHRQGTTFGIAGVILSKPGKG